MVSNHGMGGNTHVHLHLLSRQEQIDIQVWLKSQPPKVLAGDPPLTIPMDLETIVDDLFEKWLDEKHGPTAQIKKWCKTKIVIKLIEHRPDEYLVIKKPPQGYTKQVRASIAAKYRDRLESILNEAVAGEVAV